MDWMAAVGKAITSRNDIIMIIIPAYLYFIEFTVTAPLYSVLSITIYNLFRVATRPETITYGFPFHLLMSASTLFFASFLSADIHHFLSARFAMVRREKKAQEKVFALQRYVRGRLYTGSSNHQAPQTHDFMETQCLISHWFVFHERATVFGNRHRVEVSSASIRCV